MFSCFSLSAYIRYFVNVLIEMNVNINNELNFSDVYRSVNYTGSLAKFTWTPLGFIHCTRPNVVYISIRGSFTLHASQCSLHFDKPQKNEIASLINQSVMVFCTHLQTNFTCSLIGSNGTSVFFFCVKILEATIFIVCE